MLTCSSCGEPVAQDARFCPACGVALDARPPAREARKVVSALFADMVGSTGLAERLDPEDFKSVVDGAVQRMVRAIESFGGAVLQVAGDGMLALFGAPAAHEDDPERAVLAGLRIVEDIEAYARSVATQWGVQDLAVRVGIETGLVAVGLVGGGAKVEYGAAGDALNTAARLQAASDAGRVLVGPDTQRLIAPLFLWDEPRVLTLKGKAEPVIAHPVSAGRAAPVRARARGIQADIVGREHELALGTEAIEHVLDGSGRVLLVSGEAGIGKSRIVSELRDRFETSVAEGEQLRWFEGRCVSYGEALPYWPFRGLLRDWLARGDQAGPDLATALRRECERLFGDRAGELVALLQAVVGAGIADASAAGGVPPEVLQRQIQDAVVMVLRALAQVGPLAVSLDDLHWADSSSLALLERVLGLVGEARMLLVMVARPESGHPFSRLAAKTLRELPQRSQHLSLASLGADLDRRLLHAFVGADTLPAELERRLLGRAEGNPFYLEELVRSLVDGGALARVDAGWQFDREIPVEVPETVEKVILARVDRLDADAHELLGVAAVLGRQFPKPLLESVAGLGERTNPALRELHVADLLHEGAQWPTPSCMFKHTLIQEATYRSLLKRRRQELHSLAVAAIEDLYADRLGDFWGTLAHHASAAGDDARAIEYHARSGAAARRVHAVDEAIEQYGGALQAARRLGLEPTDVRVRDASLQRGSLLFDRGDTGAARVDLEQAVAGATQAGDAEMQVEALMALGGFWRTVDFAHASDLMDDAVRVSETAAVPVRVRALARLSIQHASQLRLDRALATGEQALAVAEELDADEGAIALAMDALKLTALWLGDLTRLADLTRELARILRAQVDDDFYLQFVLLESAFAPLGAGRFEEAIAGIEEALALVRQRGRLIHEPLFIDALCWAHRSRGDYQQALAFGRSASELAHGIGHSEWAAWADATLGWALLDARAPAAAAACLERGVRTAEKASLPAQLVRCVALLAWARSMLGEHVAAAALAARADQLLGTVSTPADGAWLFGAHAYVAAARAHLGCGDAQRSEGLLTPILAAAERAGWKEAIACASLVIGQARSALGDDAGAEVALARALEVADAAGLPAPAWEVRTTLAQLLGRLGRDAEAAARAGQAEAILHGLTEPLADPALRAALLAHAPASSEADL